jgi:hypothetical protein
MGNNALFYEASLYVAVFGNETPQDYVTKRLLI